MPGEFLDTVEGTQPMLAGMPVVPGGILDLLEGEFKRDIEEVC